MIPFDVSVLPRTLTLEQLDDIARAFGFKVSIEVTPLAPVEPVVGPVSAAPEPAPEPPAEPAPTPAPRKRASRAVAVKVTHCRSRTCGKELPIKTGPGRKPEYCDKACKDRESRTRALEAEKAPTPTPVTREPKQPAVEKCPRCHEVGHKVLACPMPLVKKRDRREPSKVKATCAPASRKTEPTVVIDLVDREEAAPVREVSDDSIAQNGLALSEQWRTGLPDEIKYEYLPDVLALYGVDQNILDSCLRFPERVEVRPESFDKAKRYVVLGFFKGDVNVILGMRNPQRPTVIAAYVGSMLEHDTHRVGYTGGGGTKAVKGLPRTPRQLSNRLRMIGCEVEFGTEEHTPVIYKGQDLGKVKTRGTREQVESDYQRILRKVTAIDQRVPA